MATMEQKKRNFISLVKTEFGQNRDYVTRQEILFLREKYKIPRPTWIKDPQYHIGRGRYKLPVETYFAPTSVHERRFEEDDVDVSVDKNFSSKNEETPENAEERDLSLVPKKNPNFVPFGAFDDVYDIIKSGIFFPVFLTGPTRSGKTEIPIQVCALLKRNLYRVNITIETDETDLIGGMRLVDGNTVWEDGPVIKAMEDHTGGVLLLDEIDLGSNKIMCLQPVYEGNGIYIKKMNRWVYPAKGFTIVATANTKGRGSEDGRYIGTNVMNDALLERLAGATFEQGYPPKNVEIKILNNHLRSYGITDSNFSECLAQWAENIRKTFDAGGVDEVITTGRLIHIIKAYSIFGRDRKKAIKLALARFDVNTQTSFLDMYTKIDPSASEEKESTKGTTTTKASSSPETKYKPW